MIRMPLPRIPILANICRHPFISSSMLLAPFCFFAEIKFTEVFLRKKRDGKRRNFNTERLCEINNNQSAMARGEFIYNVLQPCMTFPLSMCQVFFTMVDTEG